jgi:hypothetical protein
VLWLPQSPNERGPTREQIIFRFKLKGKGRSIQGVEQKRDAQSLLPLPDEEIERWRAQVTDCWRGWPGMAETVRRERQATLATRDSMQRLFCEMWAGRIE